MLTSFLSAEVVHQFAEQSFTCGILIIWSYVL